MRAVAGAIVLLAGAVLAGAGVVGGAALAAANLYGGPTSDLAILVGAVAVLVGFGLLVKGLNEKAPATDGPPAAPEAGGPLQTGVLRRG
jgi:hypothetical protein